jgi:hypothetical protein
MSLITFKFSLFHLLRITYAPQISHIGPTTFRLIAIYFPSVVICLYLCSLGAKTIFYPQCMHGRCLEGLRVLKLEKYIPSYILSYINWVCVCVCVSVPVGMCIKILKYNWRRANRSSQSIYIAIIPPLFISSLLMNIHEEYILLIIIIEYAIISLVM